MNRIALTLILCSACAVASQAMDIEAASGRFGVAIVSNGSGLGAASPVVNTLGGAMALSFQKGFFLTLQPSIDLYWTNYEWASGRAVPTESERGEGNNAFVLGFIIDLPVTATLRFSERLGGAAAIGTALVMRASFGNDDSAGVEAAMASNLSSIASYFWSAGRWIYPSFALRLDVYLQQNFTFAFGVRGLLPIFNAWTGNPNFFDEGIVHITMAMLVGLE